MYKRRVENGRLLISGDDGKNIMSMLEKSEKCSLNIEVDGNVTTDVANFFGDELMSAALAFDDITIDFTEVGFISNAGFKVLLELQNNIDNMNGKALRIKKLTPKLRTAFEEIGYDALFLYAE